MMMQHRIFSAEQFNRYCRLVQEAPKNFVDLASALANEAEVVDEGWTLDIAYHENRRALADCLLKGVAPDSPRAYLVNELRFWAWVSAAHAHLFLRPEISDRDLGEDARWIPQTSSTRFHRHLFRGPYLVALANRSNIELAMAALATPVMSPGEVVERVCGKAHFAHGTAMALATRLYFDASEGKLKSGSGDAKAGGARRLSYFLSQIDLTVDYPSMDVDELLAVLPEEFGRFK